MAIYSEISLEKWRCSIVMLVYIWLVVSTPLKNISQMALLFPIYGKI
jgi:hypothetical protein